MHLIQISIYAYSVLILLDLIPTAKASKTSDLIHIVAHVGIRAAHIMYPYNLICNHGLSTALKSSRAFKAVIKSLQNQRIKVGHPQPPPPPRHTRKLGERSTRLQAFLQLLEFSISTTPTAPSKTWERSTSREGEVPTPRAAVRVLRPSTREYSRSILAEGFVKSSICPV